MKEKKKVNYEPGDTKLNRFRLISENIKFVIIIFLQGAPAGGAKNEKNHNSSENKQNKTNNKLGFFAYFQNSKSKFLL